MCKYADVQMQAHALRKTYIKKVRINDPDFFYVA